MSFKKLALALALLLVVAVQVVPAFSQTSCPPPRKFTGACIDVVVWATDPVTGICCMYPNPCSAPRGWTLSYTGCAAYM